MRSMQRAGAGTAKSERSPLLWWAAFGPTVSSLNEETGRDQRFVYQVSEYRNWCVSKWVEKVTVVLGHVFSSL